MSCDGSGRPIKVKVKLTKAEYDRLMYLLHRPVPPGREKALDESIIRKIVR